jgi:hypothetical protein
MHLVVLPADQETVTDHDKRQGAGGVGCRLQEITPLDGHVVGCPALACAAEKAYQPGCAPYKDHKQEGEHRCGNPQPHRQQQRRLTNLPQQRDQHRGVPQPEPPQRNQQKEPQYAGEPQIDRNRHHPTQPDRSAGTKEAVRPPEPEDLRQDNQPQHGKENQSSKPGGDHGVTWPCWRWPPPTRPAGSWAAGRSG